MAQSHAFVSLVARALLSAIFLWSGIGKITGYEDTLGYMQAFGVPGILLPAVIVAEVGGGLAILLGVMTRYAALALAIFTIVAALVFHANFGDEMQLIMFMKNLAIAGGLMLLAANGPGALALKD